MRADLALLFSVLAAIAIVGLIVRNGTGFAAAAVGAGNSVATAFSAAENPAYYEHVS